MTEMRWVEVAEADELWEGEMIDFEVDGEQILVAHLVGGEVKAFQGLCPHQEILLVDGEFDPDKCELTCGGHHWQFDLRTGEGINPVGSQLYSFPTRVVGEKIEIGIPQDGQRHDNRFWITQEEAG